MTKRTEVTVEEKLRTLYDLQLIDSQIDELQNVRGELPLEVQDLEDEVEGLTNRLSKFKEELEYLQTEVTNKKMLLKKPKHSLRNTTNSRKMFETIVNIIL